ncbi:unnamed protein product [Leuciscus chuanchicus]
MGDSPPLLLKLLLLVMGTEVLACLRTYLHYIGNPGAPNQIYSPKLRVLVERDPGGRRFCPARRDLNPSRLPKYPMTVVFDTSADNPRAVLGQKRRSKPWD